jgi:hypothetical protein
MRRRHTNHADRHSGSLCAPRKSLEGLRPHSQYTLTPHHHDEQHDANECTASGKSYGAERDARITQQHCQADVAALRAWAPVPVVVAPAPPPSPPPVMPAVVVSVTERPCVECLRSRSTNARVCQ